ncbi:MAG: hypothetical protein FWE08_00435 [Oscillospiraceae bacterium]|nr:hypothetical protein [Oscillospiraceae bacterium]
MKKRIFVVLLTALLCVGLLTACGSISPEEAIIGSWACQQDDSPSPDWIRFFTFYEDGTFIDGDGDWGTFRIDGDTLFFDFDSIVFFPFDAHFTLRENQLILRSEAGDDYYLVLVRQ